MINYYDVKAINASAIKAGAISMLAMQHEVEIGKEASAAMRKGSLRHMAVLEPCKFGKLIVADFDGRTKEGKATIATYGREKLIKPAEFEAEKKAAEMVFNHPVVSAMGLMSGGEAEKEIYWKKGIVDCKAKLDYVRPSHIVEFKTTGNLAGFARTAAGMNYQLQLAWYWYAGYELDGVNRKVYIVAQEQAAPFDVAVYEVPQLMLEKWLQDCMNIVERYINGDRSGAYNQLMTFELPSWAEAAPEMVIDETGTIQF